MLRTKYERKQSTDCAMKNIWLRLHSDLAKNVENTYDEQFESLKAGDYVRFRKSQNTYIPFFGKAFTVKARCQLNGFLDRYTFEHDLLSPQERIEKTFADMLKDQERISTFHSHRTSTDLVVRHARRIIKGILGTYDYEEHVSSCQFGRRASVGNPYSRAYLDVKLCKDPLTGSEEHIKWFKNYLKHDVVLQRVLYERPGKSRMFTVCNELAQSFAPKSYKKVRGIVPNTLLGTFYTYGVGQVLASRLKDAGLPINKLQDRHKRIAKLGSKHRHIVTADLKSASDSLTSTLVRKLLPRQWWNVLKLGRIPYIRFNSVTYRTETFAGMGNGFTFPLQTLVFYSLCKAVGELLRVEGIYSVYGDDLIYPSQIHKYLRDVLNDLGFILNHEKTFKRTFFRESCGGDYYHGVDVRPVRPEGQAENLTPVRFAMFLYKIRNGLRRKWELVELPMTYAFIDVLIVRTIGCLHVVPPLFPDTAGIKSSSTSPVLWGDLPITFGFPILKPKYNVGKQHWTFWFLKESVKSRRVISCNPYYWVALGHNKDSESHRWRNVSDTTMLTWKYQHTQRKQHGRDLVYFSKGPLKRPNRKIESVLVPVTPDRQVKEYARGEATIFEWPAVSLNS